MSQFIGNKIPILNLNFEFEIMLETCSITKNEWAIFFRKILDIKYRIKKIKI